jgi:4a-hydroxytetrahydrobiopterin dehydratase
MGSAQDVLTRTAIDEELKKLPDWRYRLGSLYTVYKLDSARKALDLVAAAGDIAEELNHHPDLDWRYNRVFITLTSHDAGSEVTSRDIAAASSIGRAAAALGAVAEPGRSRTVEIGIDAKDPAALSELWRKALGYKAGRFGDLMDPFGRGPTVWFQQTDTPSENRLHLDIHWSESDIAPVLEHAAEAGGRLDTAQAPMFTIVTDPDGNRFCLCTEHGHGPDEKNLPASG